MLISALAFTAMSTGVKVLKHYQPFEIVFFRCIVTLLICFIFIKRQKISLWGNQKILLFGRSLVGVTSMVLFFYSIQIMPLGSAVTLRYLAPIFAAIMAVLFLRERMAGVQWIYILMAFFGVVLLKGFEVSITYWGLAVTLAAAFFSGCVYVFLRAIGNGDHPIVVVFNFMLVAAVISGSISAFYWDWPSFKDLLLLLSLGIFGYWGQLYMTKAFQLDQANKIAPLKYIEALLSILIGWIIFDERYTLYGLLGIFLVIVGMLLNMREKSASPSG